MSFIKWSACTIPLYWLLTKNGRNWSLIFLLPDCCRGRFAPHKQADQADFRRKSLRLVRRPGMNHGR